MLQLSFLLRQSPHHFSGYEEPYNLSLLLIVLLLLLLFDFALTMPYSDGTRVVYVPTIPLMSSKYYPTLKLLQRFTLVCRRAHSSLLTLCSKSSIYVSELDGSCKSLA
jgi:hypothetical protein